jgi:hypothetical protein
MYCWILPGGQPNSRIEVIQANARGHQRRESEGLRRCLDFVEGQVARLAASTCPEALLPALSIPPPTRGTTEHLESQSLDEILAVLKDVGKKLRFLLCRLHADRRTDSGESNPAATVGTFASTELPPARPHNESRAMIV